MTDYRHAGTFWPANAGGEHPDVATILGLPGSGSLVFVVADSARWWWQQIKARADLAVWRGLPRPDRLPAMLGWDANRVADECMNLFDEQAHSGTEWFTPLNELQFRRESGEDWQGYTDMAVKLARLRIQLRRKFTQKYPQVAVRLLFPAWVPGDDLDRIGEWVDEAMQWDGLRLHAYNNATEVRSRYWRLRTELTARYGEQGRTFPILVDETNANHTGADERDMLIANAEVCRDDPHCLGFCWYIWETRNEGEGDLSIWGNPDRLALFQNPPVVADPPAPEPDEPEEPEEPEPMPELSRGIDVASYQGYPDWDAVAAAGYVFAITKVTEDTGYVNPTFAHNWAGIKAAGMIRGAYHFARPGGFDAADEANFFLNVIDSVGGLEQGDLLALDIESGSGDMGRWSLDFLRACEARCGFKPLVYTGRWFMDGRSFDEPELADYGLWLAAYQDQMPAPPAPWSTLAFWQHSSSGRVPGIVGDVDLNVFNGSADRIALYGKPAPAEPEPSPFVVGPGIAAKMAALGDAPATNERYIDDDWSEAAGTSGRRYVYLKATNTVHVFDPAA